MGYNLTITNSLVIILFDTKLHHLQRISYLARQGFFAGGDGKIDVLPPNLTKHSEGERRLILLTSER